MHEVQEEAEWADVDALPVRRIAAADVDGARYTLIAAHTAAGTLSARYAAQPLTDLLSAAAVGRGIAPPVFLVAASDRGPVAGVIGVARTFCSAAGWEIGFLAVHPAAQGQGLGRRLVEQAMDGVRGAGGAFVLARAYHPPLFESVGFRRIGDGLPALMLAEFG